MAIGSTATPALEGDRAVGTRSALHSSQQPHGAAPPPPISRCGQRFLPSPPDRVPLISPADCPSSAVGCCHLCSPSPHPPLPCGFLPLSLSQAMATMTQTMTQSAITLRGSAEVVTEFFGPPTLLTHRTFHTARPQPSMQRTHLPPAHLRTSSPLLLLAPLHAMQASASTGQCTALTSPPPALRSFASPVPMFIAVCGCSVR